MAQKYEKIDGKVLISELDMNTMLGNSFEDGVKYGKDVATAEHHQQNRRNEICSDQMCDVKELFDQAVPRRTRKTKKSDHLPPSGELAGDAGGE